MYPPSKPAHHLSRTLNNTQTVNLSKNFLFWFGEGLSVTSEKGKTKDNNRAVPKPRNSPQDHHQLICSGNCESGC